MKHERAYRIHWAMETRDGPLLRWEDLFGTVATIREAALSKAAKSPDKAVRLSLKFPPNAGSIDVITGTDGLRQWSENEPLPPQSPNAWTDRMEGSRKRASTASDVKARLRAAVDAGLIDLTTAARLSTAVDLAIGEQGHAGTRNRDGRE